MNDTKTFQENFDKIVKDSKNITVLTHSRPDWDALASSMLAYLYVKKNYPDKDVTLLYETDPNIDIKFFEIEIEYTINKDIAAVLKQSDLIILVDANSLSRVSATQSPDEFPQITTICIDHHPIADEYHELEIIEPDTICATQLLIENLSYDLEDQVISRLALVGIISDSGSFRYIASKHTRTLRLVADILDRSKLDIQEIEGFISRVTKKDLEVIGELINNLKYRTFEKLPPMSYTFISSDFANKYTREELKQGANLFMYHYLKKIDEYYWGFIVIPDNLSDYSTSFRTSPGAPSVKNLAMSFGGGGHDLAAGATIKLDKPSTPENVCDMILEKIRTFDFQKWA